MVSKLRYKVKGLKNKTLESSCIIYYKGILKYILLGKSHLSYVFVRVFIAVKRHHDHGSSYK